MMDIHEANKAHIKGKQQFSEDRDEAEMKCVPNERQVVVDAVQPPTKKLNPEESEEKAQTGIGPGKLKGALQSGTVSLQAATQQALTPKPERERRRVPRPEAAENVFSGSSSNNDIESSDQHLSEGSAPQQQQQTPRRPFAASAAAVVETAGKTAVTATKTAVAAVETAGKAPVAIVKSLLKSAHQPLSSVSDHRPRSNPKDELDEMLVVASDGWAKHTMEELRKENRARSHSPKQPSSPLPRKMGRKPSCESDGILKQGSDHMPNNSSDSEIVDGMRGSTGGMPAPTGGGTQPTRGRERKGRQRRRSHSPRHKKGNRRNQQAATKATTAAIAAASTIPQRSGLTGRRPDENKDGLRKVQSERYLVVQY